MREVGVGWQGLNAEVSRESHSVGRKIGWVSSTSLVAELGGGDETKQFGG